MADDCGQPPAEQQLTNPNRRLLLMPAESMNIAQAPETNFHGRRVLAESSERGRETGSGAPESLASAEARYKAFPGKMNLPE